MSHWRDDLADIEEPGDALTFVGRYYPLPTVLVLLGFMLYSRVRNWGKFVVDGTIFFRGNDPWYHYRMVAYTVDHWPETMPFDPWTYFPYGTNSSQFGTIYDQFMATVALILGLGSPSDHTVRLVMLFTPAIIGVATGILAYYIGRRVGGRVGGVVSVGLLALVGSSFASRGTVGFPDHQIAEAFLQALAVLATMVAVGVAKEEKPIYELFLERDVSALRRPVGWAVLAGLAIALYIWTWPPGVLLLGILGLYYLFELSWEYVKGESPEPVAITGAISMGTAGVLLLASLEEFDIQATAFSLLQPGLAFAVGFGCVFMAWLAREWDARDIARIQYPVTVIGIIAVLAGAAAVLLPDLFGYMVTQVDRVLGLSVSARAGTVGEAQPLAPGQLYARYKFVIFVGGAGGLYVLLKKFAKEAKAELLLLVVWFAIALMASLTQRRFEYYLAVPTVTLAGLLVGRFADFANLTDAASEIETYQVITVVAVVLLLFAPLVFPSALAMQETRTGVGPAPLSWNQSLDWMETNTPELGQYGGADNSLEYYGTYEKTDDFNYPDGSYGVLSWWDYGHWITVMGERVPTANPFQQGATEAANFLLSTNESQALDVLNELEENNETETKYVMVDWKMVSTETRYRTAQGSYNLGGKYFAPFSFYDAGNISQRDYYLGPDNMAYGLYYPTGQKSGVQYRSLSLRKQPYYNSTAVRLYRYHGSAMKPQPYVLDWQLKTIGQSSRQFRVSQGVKTFPTIERARNYTQNDLTSQIGGFGPYPSERVPALEHFRLVQVSDRSASKYSQRYMLGIQKSVGGAVGGLVQRMIKLTDQTRREAAMSLLHRTKPAWVKVFERVEGATVQGEAPENSTVYATVRMNVPGSNSTFTYKQRAKVGPDGSFTMTLPYSTTGYKKWGTEEGYTNPRVRALGPYEFSATAINGSDYRIKYNDTAHVTEGQVIGEDPSPVSVSLEKAKVTPPLDERGNNSKSNGTSAPDDNSGSESDSQSGTNDVNELIPSPEAAGASDWQPPVTP